MTQLVIRARRAAFNTAITNRDAASIGQFLAKNCVMVTGSDSSVVSGRFAQVKLWRSLFKSGDGANYVRTPQSIDVSQIEPIAMETGNWQGIGQDGGVLNSGTYCAKWRETGGEWQIVAEIFATLG